MTIEFHDEPAKIDWTALRDDLVADDFHNGRTVDQLRISFENSQVQIYAMNTEQDEARCIGTARALSDGIGNAYVIDVWTQSGFRGQGIASKLMAMIRDACPGQHIYLQTDDAIEFYRKLGYSEQPEGMSLVSGEYLQNHTRKD